MTNTLSDEALKKYLNQIREFYLNPEIEKRKDNNTLPSDFELTSFQVMIYMNKPIEVRINSEVKGILNIKPKKELKSGDITALDNIETIKGFELLKEDANSAHVTYLSLPSGESFLTFDYRYNTLLRNEKLKISIEFIETATTALNNNHYRSFHENLFVAMESAIAAMLISLPDESYLKTRKHNSWQTRINKWGQLGNVDMEFVALFNRLSQNRNKARYGEFTIDNETATRMIESARRFLEIVQKSIPTFH